MKTPCILFILAVSSLLYTSCTKTPDASDPAAQKKPLGATPFKGEEYRTMDGSVVITLISVDELEARSQLMGTVVCKYSKQDGKLRVVIQVLGTTQAVYFRIVEDGLERDDGVTLYNPVKYASEERRANEAQKKLMPNAPKLIIGTWLGPLGVTTYNTDGTCIYKQDNGMISKCTWSIVGDIRTFKYTELSGKVLTKEIVTRSRILEISNEEYRVKSLEDGREWHLTRVR